MKTKTNTIGDKVRHHRRKRGYSYTDLAKRSGIDRSNLCNLEKGKRGASIATVRKLAAALGISPGSLL